jgi:hypothetical protein
MARSLAAIANSVIRVEAVARLAGIDIPDITGRASIKVHCPFEDYYHPDREPALRIYPGANNAWCFACAQFWTPVSLHAAVEGLEAEAAAAALLEAAGYRPADYRQRWHAITTAAAVPDRDQLAAALSVWASASIPGWDARQYEPELAGLVARCLGLLEAVSTSADCEQWLRGCKQALRALADNGGTQ